jgi:fructose/tagatose bisphosphate aldolase
MVDGSRLSLDENIATAKEAAKIAHKGCVPVEAELGAIMGHEAGPIPPYEELFSSGKGFTDIAQARRFVSESEVDWLSVAIGNIHGAVSGVMKNEKKVAARLDINRLKELNKAVRIPLVLHGGSGIQVQFIRDAIKSGIGKINIGTNIRQPYEKALKETGSIEKAQEATYLATKSVIVDEITLERMCKEL